MHWSSDLLSEKVLRQLIIHDNGFVFDPVNGHSFTANASAVALLRAMVRYPHMSSLVQALTQEWNVTPEQIKQDIFAFINEIKVLLYGSHE